MLVELFEGFYCDPESVVVVKHTGVNECALFTEGQSAVDGGFKLDFPAKEVADEINKVLEDGDGDKDGKED